MKIKIAGISGYIGRLLEKNFTQKGYEVSGIKRQLLYGPLNDLSDEIKGCDVLINLAGAPILQRWNNKNKRTIYDSRINSTRMLVNAVNSLSEKKRPSKVISASAIGIYKNGMLHDESSTNFENSFVGNVCHDWENELTGLAPSVKLTIFRVGLVLGKEAKTIKNLLTPIKLGLGGKIGSGKQAFPFIHEKDLLSAFNWAVEKTPKKKIYNLVAPEQITNFEFTKAFADKLQRPAFFSVPSFLVKLILGQASILLLKSPMVHPQNLKDEDFLFVYPTIHTSLSEILA